MYRYSYFTHCAFYMRLVDTVDTGRRVANRPRSRCARWLTWGIYVELRGNGARSVPELLDARLSGPASWDDVERREKAAVRMALRDVLWLGVRIDHLGRLYVPPTRHRRYATPRPQYAPEWWR